MNRGILTDRDLKSLAYHWESPEESPPPSGRLPAFLQVDPILDAKTQVQGSKIDLRLDNRFRFLREEHTDHWDSFQGGEEVNEIYKEELIPYGSRLRLHPGHFVLGQTFESVRMPDDCVAYLEGRSMLARRGVLVHITASCIDPGFIGTITLELYNVGKVPVHLHPLMRVCALTIHVLDGPVAMPYWKKEAAKFGGHDQELPSQAGHDPDETFLRGIWGGCGAPDGGTD